MSAVEVLAAADPRWAAALAGMSHDVPHLAGWARASAPLEGDDAEPAAVLVEDDGERMLVPFVRRPLDGGRFDAVSPYGYAGTVTTAATPERAAELLARAAEHLAALGGVSWFVRLHPLLDAGRHDGHPGLVERGEVVTIDLTRDDDAFLASLRAGHRGDLRVAARDGLAASRRPALDGIDDFAALHAATMDRLGASDYHRFPAGHLSALATELGEALVLVEVRPAGSDEVVASALVTLAASSGIAGYHLAASVDRPPRGAAKLVIAEARRVARERGCARLLLGGGLGSGEDALFAFKAGFSPDRHRFRTLGLVLDAQEYARRFAERVGPPTDRFPAYR